MIGFFPVPYPDEVLYSVLARYHLRSRNKSGSATGKEIFGKESVRFVIDLPNKLNYLISQLPLGHNLTANRLINECTLLPFYSPFLPPDRVKQLRKDMAYNSPGGAVYGRTGILTSNIQVEYLRFCPGCVEQDYDLYGETYWHRIHQLPGVFVCPHHSIFLKNSTVKYISRSKKTNLIAAKEVIKTVLIPFDFLNLNIKSHVAHLFIAKEANWLLQNSIDYCGPDFFRKRFFQILLKKNLTYTKKSIRVNELENLFKEFYDSDFLLLLSSDLKTKHTWLRRLIQASTHFQHPIRNLLLLHFLEFNIEKFLNLPENIYPVGKPPYPCLNPFSNHYLKLTITSCDISKTQKKEMIMATFSCTCGFVYRRHGWDEEGKRSHKYDLIMNFGEDFCKGLIDLKTKGVPESKIANLLKCSEQTVSNYLQKAFFYLKNQKKIEKNLISQKIEKKRLYRKKFKELMKSYPNYGRSKLRLLSVEVYDWLIKNDKEWFKKYAPDLKKAPPKQNRIDWEARDKVFADKAEKLAIKMLSSPEKPIRVSLYGLGRKLGIAHIISKRPECLPTTIKILNKYAETVEEFIIRRIHYTTKCIINEKTVVNHSELSLRASIMKPKLYNLPKVKKALIESINQIKDAANSGWINL